MRVLGRSVPLCSGCIVFWPLVLIGTPAMVALGVHFQITWWWPVSLGLFLGSAQVLSYLQLTRTRRAKLIVKSSFGAGAAMVVSGLILAPWPGAVRLAVGLLLMVIALAFQTRRLKNITNICDACPWKRDWQHCPGFTPLNDHVPGSRPPGKTGRDPDPPRPWPWSSPYGTKTHSDP